MPRTVLVNDRMQQGYRYALTAPAGRGLRPGLPARAHAGRDAAARRVRRQVHDRLPRASSRRAGLRGAKLAPDAGDPALNFFGVDASQPLSVWRAKGWIHPDDPRGWFQWYCRYYMGRRMADDARQIGRWRAIRRHAGQLERALRTRRPPLPPAPAPGAAALGL